MVAYVGKEGSLVGTNCEVVWCTLTSGRMWVMCRGLILGVCVCGCGCVCVGVGVWVFNDVSVLEDINVACARAAELTCSGGRKWWQTLHLCVVAHLKQEYMANQDIRQGGSILQDVA